MTFVVFTSRFLSRAVLPTGAVRLQAVAGVVGRRCCWGILACLLIFVSPAFGVTPATLIGPDLNAQAVEVASLNDGTLNYFDIQRTLRSSAIDGFVQLRSIGGEDLAGPGPVRGVTAGVWLTDGQRFAGDWVGPTPDGSGLIWRHPTIGTVTIPLDEVAQVNWVGGDGLVVRRAARTMDTVTLTNGDRLSGFVSSLNDEGVVLVLNTGGAGGDGGGSMTIPFGRIASMVLSNPYRSRVEPYHRVTLVDGTRVWADELRISGDRVYCRVILPGGLAVGFESPVMELARIDFWAGGLRLIDLTELPMRTVDEASVFGLTVPVRVAGRSVRMHAPGSVVYELPEGAVRFAGVAELDFQDAPAHITDWSDFQVVVSVQEVQDQRFPVSGSQPVTRINTPISGPELTIRLDPGVNGPILDRLLLRDAVILVRLPGAEPSGDSGR